MENYSDLQNAVFKVLADPTRRAVVESLTHGPATVSDLARPFPLTLPTFMKHIDALEQAKLISTRKSGRVRTCTLNHAALAAAERWFERQRAVWAGRFDNLDGLLDQLESTKNES